MFKILTDLVIDVVDITVGVASDAAQTVVYPFEDNWHVGSHTKKRLNKIQERKLIEKMIESGTIKEIIDSER